ncbi:unnamed protein product [Gadus morhua 'NCC']
MCRTSHHGVIFTFLHRRIWPRWAPASGKRPQYFGEEEEITPARHIPAAQGSVNDTAPLGRSTDVTVDRPEQSVNTAVSRPGAPRRG